jgi:hypothetical protein
MIVCDSRYLLGILNSKISKLLLSKICDVVQGGFYRLKISYISQIPIRPIDPANPDDVAKHDRMVALVEAMLDLHRRLPAAATEHQRRLVEMQVEAADREIDALVYDLYGLAPDERAVVEAATGRTG